MSYASYEYYTGTYYGDVLTSENFDKYASRASDYIDRITMNRAKDYDRDEAVQKACCVGAEQCYRIDSARSSSAGTELASETVGRHSVTFRSGVETAKALEAELYNLVSAYLANTGLLYRGIPCIVRIP